MNELKNAEVPSFYIFKRLSEKQILNGIKHNGIKNLKNRKRQPVADILTKIIKNIRKILAYVLIYVKSSLSTGHLPSDLKKTEVVPAYEKYGKSYKSNYSPISILTSLSKLYKGCISNQIYQFFKAIFSKHLCRFQKSFKTKHCLNVMVRKSKAMLGKGKKL